MLGLLLWGALGGLAPAAARSQTHPQGAADPTGPIAVRCRLAQGPWQPCLLHVERVGEHWWIDLGQQRLEFRHDGRGTILLTQSGRAPRMVQGHWEQTPVALCWDGICAQGELPLD